MTDHLSQTVDIETPELVVVSYTIAGLGSRVYAAIIDLFICVVMYVSLIVGIVILTRGERAASDKRRRDPRRGSSRSCSFCSS